LRETHKDVKKILYETTLKDKAISGSIVMEQKICYKCKVNKLVECYGKLKSSKDGLRYDCNDCRKEYRIQNNVHIQEKNKNYYANNKVSLLVKNKDYREQNIDKICEQRKEYRNREENKEHIKQQSKDYLPIRKLKIQERRKTDINFKMSEILRSKIHKLLRNQKTSYTKYIGCDIDFLKKWIEYRFDKNMNWNNFGSYWQIDHILPINKFNFENEIDKHICFHWTNLQPLSGIENRQKSDKLLMHYYFNNIINVNRFNNKYTQYLGYQVLKVTLKWLRLELRYGKNPPYDTNVNTLVEIGNPQPSFSI